jgi:hypothetical protein
MTGNRFAVEALYEYLTEDGIPGCACSVLREQIYAWLMQEPAPEVTEFTGTRCRRCNAVYEALLSTLTPDALLQLSAEAVAGNPLAITLANLLPIRPSGLIQ